MNSADINPKHKLPKQQDPIIRVNGLHKSFGKLEVIKGISLEVQKGEIISIIGPSGSGKSTFLRCINFLEMPTGGQIFFKGQEIDYQGTSFSAKRQFRRDVTQLRIRIGMVFQSYNLWQHKTVIQNIIEAPKQVTRAPESEAIEVAESLLERFGLADKKDQYPNRLSGGQQQRVAIIRALAMKPEVMLFDEVTSALDPELVGEVLDVLQVLAQEGMTMLLVTHEIGFAKHSSTRTLFMDEGVILEQGSSDQVLNHPVNERTKIFLQRVMH